MKTLSKLIVAAIVVFAAIQLIRPSIPEKPAIAEVQAPPQVKAILQKDCYSCHSDERRLAWFDQIQPAYTLVRYDVLTARQHVDFSTLGAKPAPVQKATLYEAVNMIQLGAMPLPRFLQLHPDARVTPDDLAILKAYLAPWSALPPAAAITQTSAAPQKVSLASVHDELNGQAFEPDFESWKLLDITDRGDNGTFRFILGNDVAQRAVQSGSLSPWPDGAKMAKVAWQQQLGPDGLVHPGNFIQVEIMAKDAARYKATEGWGFGRWRTLQLDPYGTDAHFDHECTGCHQPVRGDDYVYTLPITAAHVGGTEVVNNHAAALPASLPYPALSWNPITMLVDPRAHTMATLFGNDAAMQAVHAASAAAPAYSAGSVLALVTWAQRDDPHWFGARIPDSPVSVEFVEVAPQPTYRRFAGPSLNEDHPAAPDASARTAFLLHLTPAQLP